MLVEGLYMGDHIFTQKRTFMRQKQVLELQGVMNTRKQFPDKHFNGYSGVSAERQAMQSFNTSLKSITSLPTSNTNSSLISRAAVNGSTVLRKMTNPKITEKVSAFGPRHAEHARRLYQKGIQSQEFRQVLPPSYRPNYRPMLISNHMQASKTQSNETVIKIATITPRPCKKQLHKKKPSLVSRVKLSKDIAETGLGKKSVDFQDSISEIDLLNAPLFQILCEITNTSF